MWAYNVKISFTPTASSKINFIIPHTVPKGRYNGSTVDNHLIIKIISITIIMVQIYNPNIVGKQILIDVKNISGDKLKSEDNINVYK